MRARSVLPDPGGPIMSRPCPPASAISSARRPRACPRTSARSGTSRGRLAPCHPLAGASTGAGAGRSGCPRELNPGRRLEPARRSARRCEGGRRRRPGRPPAGSRRGRPGPASARLPRARRRGPPLAWRAPRPSAGSPARGRSSPPSESSPMNAQWPVARTCSEPSRIPTAIARSSDAPALRRSAGARLTVIRRGGNARPLLRMAPRTRSRASWNAASGRPTIVNPGRPGATSTSTRMTRPSMPWSVAAWTVASTAGG